MHFALRIFVLFMNTLTSEKLFGIKISLSLIRNTQLCYSSAFPIEQLPAGEEEGVVPSTNDADDSYEWSSGTTSNVAAVAAPW